MIAVTVLQPFYLPTEVLMPVFDISLEHFHIGIVFAHIVASSYATTHA
jgi:hypothetical protein